MRASEFWQDREESARASEELAHLKEEIRTIEDISKLIRENEEFVEYVEKDNDLAREVEKNVSDLEKSIAEEEVKLYFFGPYDQNSAIITLYSGAGGLDAQDWAGMLLRMYERYSKAHGYRTSVISKSFGEEKGIKEAVLEVNGRYAYGYLKNENGVHRLVRISPFSAQKLRHTSFVLVEVLPQLQAGFPDEIIIRPEDIEVQTFRSSGPGGQYVNKTESAVRIKHLATGIVVACQSERLQGENKAKALRLLSAKLFARRMKDKKEKLEALKGGFIAAEWGSQIRSYVLNPYKMVKDHRTGVETSDADGVLDGKLEGFIEAEVRV